MRSLGEAQAAVLELEGRVAAEAAERDRLVDRRFGLLSSALGTINAELSQARRRGGGRGLLRRSRRSTTETELMHIRWCALLPGFPVPHCMGGRRVPAVLDRQAADLHDGGLTERAAGPTQVPPWARGILH